MQVYLAIYWLFVKLNICENVLTKFDQGMNLTVKVRIFNLSIPQYSGPWYHAQVNMEMEAARWHSCVCRELRHYPLINIDFRVIKRTWQKLTASSMALTVLSFIGHSECPRASSSCEANTISTKIYGLNKRSLIHPTDTLTHTEREEKYISTCICV